MNRELPVPPVSDPSSEGHGQRSTDDALLPETASLVRPVSDARLELAIKMGHQLISRFGWCGRSPGVCGFSLRDWISVLEELQQRRGVGTQTQPKIEESPK